MNRHLPAIALLSLSGCSSQEKIHDFVKDIEGKAYDRLAGAISEYCAKKNQDGIGGSILTQEALEARREIRQRGHTGPPGPALLPGSLDEKTAYGPGPVMRIYCEGESVPEKLWQDFIRE